MPGADDADDGMLPGASEVAGASAVRCVPDADAAVAAVLAHPAAAMSSPATSGAAMARPKNVGMWLKNFGMFLPRSRLYCLSVPDTSYTPGPDYGLQQFSH